MKTPFKATGLPDMPPFPHEYSRQAEHLIKQVEYNLRVRLWDFIRAAAKTDPEGHISPAIVLGMALQSQAKIMQGQADTALEGIKASDATDRMLKELGF